VTETKCNIGLLCLTRHVMATLSSNLPLQFGKTHLPQGNHAVQRWKVMVQLINRGIIRVSWLSLWQVVCSHSHALCEQWLITSRWGHKHLIC